MEKQKNIPMLRFPGFEGERLHSSYKNYRFEDIFLFSTGKNIKQDEAAPDFEIPCVRYGELYHMYNEVIFEVFNRTNLNRDELIFSKGDEILLPSAGEDPLDIGSASALPFSDIAIGRTINILRPKLDSLYSQIYVSYYINQKLKGEIAKLAKGVSISNVYNSDLKKLEITLPSLPEQQKIATFLTSVDEKLQGLQQQKVLLEQYKKGVMQRLFLHELRFKDKDGSEFPAWEEKKLGEITFKVDKKNKDKEDLPVYSISNVNGFVPQSEQFEGLDSIDRGYDTSLYKIVEKETFAYNPARINVGSIGYSGNIEKAIVSSLYVCFKTTDNVYDYFFNFYLQTMHFQTSVLRHGEGGVRIYLFYENFSEITINLPSLEEQTRIAAYLTALDAKIAAVQAQAAGMAAWKKGLLQGMFV